MYVFSFQLFEASFYFIFFLIFFKQQFKSLLKKRFWIFGTQEKQFEEKE